MVAEIHSVVAAAIVRDRALEMNANGYLWSTLTSPGTPDPFAVFVEQIAAQGACVTVGSDAHTPANTGASLPELSGYLQDHGVARCGVFHRRQRTLETLG